MYTKTENHFDHLTQFYYEKLLKNVASTSVSRKSPFWQNVTGQLQRILSLPGYSSIETCC